MVTGRRAQPGEDELPPSLSPADVAVAATLSRRPFGMRSARAVAKASGIGYSATRRSLGRLHAAGIVQRREDRVAEGAARSVTVWTIDWRSARWHAVAAEVGRATARPEAEPLAAPPARLPARLAHLFWNVELGHVDLDRHGAYVASRILRSNDCQALGWLARHLDPQHLRTAARGRGLDPRRAQLANLLAGASSLAPAPVATI
jgi:hypothetical protein